MAGDVGPGKISPVTWRQKKNATVSCRSALNSIWPLGKEHLEPMGGLSGVTGLDYNWTATWPAPHCWQASLCHAHGAAKVEATKSGGNATLSNGKMDMATSWLCPKMVSMAKASTPSLDQAVKIRQARSMRGDCVRGRWATQQIVGLVQDIDFVLWKLTLRLLSLPNFDFWLGSMATCNGHDHPRMSWLAEAEFKPALPQPKDVVGLLSPGRKH